MTPSPQCTCCDSTLDAGEQDFPYRNEQGEILCDECYREKYEYTCCWCENYDHIDHQHELLVVFDDDLGVSPGVYRIVDSPYYTSPLIGKGWLHPACLERLCDLPADLETDGYPCGHLCQKCQQEIGRKAVTS